MASSHSWTKLEVAAHTEAARKLGLIKDEVASFIAENKKNVYEADVVKFVKDVYKRHGLVNDHEKEFAICAFGKNTSEVHYFPKGKGMKLKAECLVLLDIWARLDNKKAPYADMTWMFYLGRKVPAGIQKKWNILKLSRDTAIKEVEKYLRKDSLPRGLDIDRVAHDVIGAAGYGESIKHTVGHSLGFDSPHGKLPGINWKEYKKLSKNVGYTIEPGIYFKDKYGFRTEIDFYISSDSKIVITTPVQKSIDHIV